MTNLSLFGEVLASMKILLVPLNSSMSLCHSSKPCSGASLRSSDAEELRMLQSHCSPAEPPTFANPLLQHTLR
jgi:hypothetical protein